MPQLDSWTYLGQVSWACAALFLVYFGSKTFLLPRLAISLKTPVKLQASLGSSQAALQKELDYTRSL